MKTIRSWMSHHPFKVVLFTFIFTLIPSLMAVTNERLFYPGLAAFLIFLTVLVSCWWKHGKTLPTVLVITALLAHASAAEPEPEFRPAAGYAVGAVVICVGGYCIYKMVKVCQKLFPPKGSGETNSSGGLTITGNDEYGAAYEYSSIGSCNMPTANILPFEDLTKNPTTFTLNILLNDSGASVSMSANNQEGTAQTWEQFTAEMAGHGLLLTGRAAYDPQFSRNRVPCDGSAVPLSFEPNNGRIIHNSGGEVRRVTVERSVDLKDWYPFMVTDTGEGSGFKVIDTTREGQMFYRVQVTQP